MKLSNFFFRLSSGFTFLIIYFMVLLALFPFVSAMPEFALAMGGAFAGMFLAGFLSCICDEREHKAWEAECAKMRKARQ